MYIHLNTHSCYSFLEALPTPKELAQAAAQAGMPALALTDHGWLSGAVEFFLACRDAGVQPILGLELDIDLPAEVSFSPADVPLRTKTRVILLAMDLQGWGGLCRLSSLSNGGTAQAVPFESLAEEARGLLCLAGIWGSRAEISLRGEGRRAATAEFRALADLFDGRLYVALQQLRTSDRNQVDRTAVLARKLKLPMVPVQPVSYLKAGEAALQKVLAAIRLNKTIGEISSEECAPPEAYFTSTQEMSARFTHYPAAIEASLEIAARCRFELPLNKPHYPEIPLPQAVSALGLLRQKAQAGARALYGDMTPGIQRRLDQELGAIGEYGYAALFLIVEEIIAFARQSGIPISSRGSAASSLVAHCLGITSPDPLRLNLYFERFLNPARLTPPDIDTDLCSRRRDEVIQFVYKRFGASHVAMVATTNRFRPRSALREVAKAHGLSPRKIDSLVEGLPHRSWGPPGHPSRPRDPYAELSQNYPDERYQAIFRDASALLGLPRHLSVHPGGIVIASGPITDLSPTMLPAKGVVVTQFDLDSIEPLGLVKIDLLGIRGLTVLGDVAQAVASGMAGEETTPSEVLETIPEDDPLTSDLVRRGDTIGCFQIESPGMRTTLKEIQAASVDDLMVALALYRPGPLSGGLKEAFVRRHRGLEEPAQLHPALASLLEDTYGVILYQEQVLRIAHELGGFSLADADLLRRAMSHFDPGKQMLALKEKFLTGAMQRSQMPAQVAERVWELMAAFAGYGFPKAHAASYAQVAWRAAWCKVHFPAIFMAAVLANWGGYYSQGVYLNEARRLGLSIRTPHVNYAQREFSVSYVEGAPALFMGLDQVRDLTRRTQTRILRERPFHSLVDFLARVDPRPIEAENLVKVGALEDFGSIPEMLAQLQAGGWRGGQLLLFSVASKREEDWPLAQRMAAQEQILGVSVDIHPLELLSDEIAAAGALNTVEAAAQVGRQVLVAGTRQAWHRSLTSRGDYLYFLSLEDLDGMLDVIIFPDVYRRYQKILRGPGPYLIEGVVELEAGQIEPSLRAKRVSSLVSSPGHMSS